MFQSSYLRLLPYLSYSLSHLLTQLAHPLTLRVHDGPYGQYRRCDTDVFKIAGVVAAKQTVGTATPDHPKPPKSMERP